MGAALDFWVGLLGFECVAHAEGDDPGLRDHWGVTDRQIAAGRPVTGRWKRRHASPSVG